MADFRVLLEKLHPNVSLSVELPHSGNGNLFQVRTTLSDGLIFYGRAEMEEEAILKCCQKAVKHLQKNHEANYMHNAASNSNQHQQTTRKRQPPPSRRRDEQQVHPPRSRPNSKVSNRELELRNEMGDVLDRVQEWNRRYEERGGSSSHESRAPRRRGQKPRPRSPTPDHSLSSSTSTLTSQGQTSSGEDFMANLKGKPVQIKNAVMMLNEMFPPPKAPQYKVTSQTGPPNNPTFSMVCCIQEQTFPGEGKSKKEAKLACSQKAIETICGFKMGETTKSSPEKSNPRASCDLDDWMELEGKNPVSILNELYPGIQYQLISTSGPSHAPQFVIRASLNDMSFEGSGKSKKDAKLNASKALLVHLHQVGFDPMTGDMMSTQQNNTDVASGHSFADKIGQLVTNKYQALFGTTTYSKRRVMAGVVMTTPSQDEEAEEDEDQFEVICVSSGTKCINGEQLSLEGCVINDSHAEIVARRALIVFLYNQLELFQEDQDKSVFQLAEDGKFKLKKGVGFHLFITTSPCGDARIFSLHESSSTNNLESKVKLSDIESAEQKEEVVKEEEETKDEDIDDEIKDDVDDSTSITSGSVNSAAEVCEMAADDNLKDHVEEFVKVEEPKEVLEDENNNISEDLKENAKQINYGNDDIAIYVTDMDDEFFKKRPSPRPPADSSRGMLRSKIECGMGTVPLSPKIHLQTWDGVMSGDRLLTMACSDKILRWNVVGIQGALLTHLIHPIYLKSITVGSKFHPGHMKRALYERIVDHILDLPSAKYFLNMPQLYATTSPETRQATKAHDYSVNWILDHGHPEIVNGSTGKTINENTSRLSKKSLFTRFLKVGELVHPDWNLFKSPIQYSGVKQMAEEYQKSKEQVTKALMDAGCGHWIEKPVEQDQFSL